ncbi:hypothetical protein KY289_004535 [Solanum tuberosum]|nr:hypothetical protein KY289_004535 [Solanum tuberosum]
MGSEGPSPVIVHVTGFKKFHGVAENPTETIVSNLKDYMKKRGMPKGLILGSCSILDTAGQGALVPLYQTLQAGLSGGDSESSNSRRVIWVHFGVNSGATMFAIENQAVNEATFRCPDEMGWKPQKVPIVPADGAISRKRETSLPVEEMTKVLAKMGYEVMTSDDAGRAEWCPITICTRAPLPNHRRGDTNAICCFFAGATRLFILVLDFCVWKCICLVIYAVYAEEG